MDNDTINVERSRKKNRTRKGYHFISDRRFEELTFRARKETEDTIRQLKIYEQMLVEWKEDHDVQG